MIRLSTAVVLLACIPGLAACGENPDQRAAGSTVSRFYEALKQHDAKTACGLVSPTIANAMVRASGEGGKPCVAALTDAFRHTDPDRYDKVPHVDSTLVNGDHATVVISLNYEKRKVGLTRTDSGWRITNSPDFGV